MERSFRAEGAGIFKHPCVYLGELKKKKIKSSRKGEKAEKDISPGRELAWGRPRPAAVAPVSSHVPAGHTDADAAVGKEYT